MEPQSLGLLVAFSAGLLSFLSPCVLPLVPSYATFITGMSLDELRDAETARTRRAVLVHGVLFVLGFTLVFMILGASATFLGSLLAYASRWVERVGGVLLILFGLYLLGVLRLPGAGREWRMHLADKPVGYLGTLLVGITFGAGWTPCIGPVLGRDPDAGRHAREHGGGDGAAGGVLRRPRHPLPPLHGAHRALPDRLQAHPPVAPVDQPRERRHAAGAGSAPLHGIVLDALRDALAVDAGVAVDEAVRKGVR
jgi:hypothetical protein